MIFVLAVKLLSRLDETFACISKEAMFFYVTFQEAIISVVKKGYSLTSLGKHVKTATMYRDKVTNGASESPKPKDTSFEYGMKYQTDQIDKFRNRKRNHWKSRIELAHNLIERYALPEHLGKNKRDIVVVDIGCSIGTFAIEFAKLGYNSYGIDFDRSAIEIAKQLSIEEDVTPEFVCGDVSDWNNALPPVDIAICFDIFEHLHDDELGSLLSSLRTQFSDKGVLIFHTFPTQYNYIFFNRRRYMNYPLIPFRNVSEPSFNKIVKLYSALLDVPFLIKEGKTYKETLKLTSHCNALTCIRLTDILSRAGYKTLFIESNNLYHFKRSVQKLFCKQPISFRNLYGVAVAEKR